MWKKKILRIGAVTVMFLLMCGCVKKDEPALPLFIIGSDDYEPYSYADVDGEPAGMDVELAREACRRMGYEPVFRYIGWNERDDLLDSGGVDCLWSCYSMDGQKDHYEWVGPYMRSRQVVAVLADSRIHALGDLEGKSVAVRVGSKAEQIFLGNTDSVVPRLENVYAQNSMDEIVTALRNGYVDAIAGYAAALRETLRDYDVDYRFLGEDLSHDSLGVAFSKDSDPALREKLREALDEMLSDGTTKHILKDNYGVNIEKALGELGDE